MAVSTAFYRRAETLYAPKNRAKLIISLLSVSAAEKKIRIPYGRRWWRLLSRHIWVKCRAEVRLKKKISIG